MAGRKSGWWDKTRNVCGGCLQCSPGCLFCYALKQAATLHRSLEHPLYGGTTKWRLNKRDLTEDLPVKPVWSGRTTVLPPDHPEWDLPISWSGVRDPVMGEGQPSLIFEGSMTDLFFEDRPEEVIDRALQPYQHSRHIGLILTRRVERMAEYFLAGGPPPRRRGLLPPLPARQKLWLGFSAERQQEFDQRWPHMRKLAQAGWTVYCPIAPMLGPVRLPPDFLEFGDRIWCIASGEQGKGWRPMDPSWPRAVRDQCRDAGVPFLMNQMAGRKPIPHDLLIHQFPRRV